RLRRSIVWWRAFLGDQAGSTPLESLLSDRGSSRAPWSNPTEQGKQDMAKRKQSTFERLTRGKLSRKERKEFQRRLQSDNPGLEVVHQHAAGIDIGNES